MAIFTVTGLPMMLLAASVVLEERMCRLKRNSSDRPSLPSMESSNRSSVPNGVVTVRKPDCLKPSFIRRPSAVRR
jgi:hypothetical protein